MSQPSAKQIAARQTRRLRAIRKQLLEMSVQWEDVDQFNMSELEGLADRTEEVAVALLDEPAK